jgi:hypothetical protein
MHTPNEPGRAQPPIPRTSPTPEDPREHEPVRDPPIYPDHDDGAVEEIRRAGGSGAIKGPMPAPDAVVNDRSH